MNRRMALLSGASLLSAGCASLGPQTSNRELVRVVTNAEMAFARTMADRDHHAFLGFVSPEAVFLNGGKPLVGREDVGRFYSTWRLQSDGRWRVVFDDGYEVCESRAAELPGEWHDAA
jgi:hypothetical protein